MPKMKVYLNLSRRGYGFSVGMTRHIRHNRRIRRPDRTCNPLLFKLHPRAGLHQSGKPQRIPVGEPHTTMRLSATDG